MDSVHPTQLDDSKLHQEFLCETDLCVSLPISFCRYPLCGHRLQHWQEFTNSIEGLDLEKKSFPKEEIVISPQRLVKKEFLDDLLSKVGVNQRCLTPRRYPEHT